MSRLLYFVRCVAIANRNSLGILYLLLLIANAQIAWAEEFDVSKSSAAKKLEKYFAAAVPGGSADIQELVLDSSSNEVRGRVKVRASHSWGSIDVPDPRPRDPFNTRKVEIEAHKTVTARFRYNLETSRVTGDVNLGRIRLSTSVAGRDYSKDFGEVRIDLDRIERILEGDWMKLVESIPNPGNVVGRERRSEYDDIVRSYYTRHGKDNVYFASPRFVNWASPERLARWGAELVVTDGAAVKRIMNEAKAEASLEQPEVINWLEKRGQHDARVVAKALLNGERVQWPNLTVQFQTVKYESRVLLSGRPVGPWVAVRHAAFVIIWKKGSTGSGTGTNDVTVTKRTGSIWGYANGEFRNNGGGQWQEFQNGQLRFTFRETSRLPDSIELLDNSRGITVTIWDTKALVKRGRETVSSLNGGWKWLEWSYSNGKGRFVQTSSNQWVEYQDGVKMFTFSVVTRGYNEIYLKDASRSIEVRLSNDQATVTRMGNNLQSIRGGWSR
jgi:hypothetical protein